MKIKKRTSINKGLDRSVPANKFWRFLRWSGHQYKTWDIGGFCKSATGGTDHVGPTWGFIGGSDHVGPTWGFIGGSDHVGPTWRFIGGSHHRF